MFRRGTGPAVIVMAEMPGITPEVVTFAERVADIGCTAALPHLFGVPGKDPNEGGRLATGKTSPVIGWLRALAEHEHERCGGPGVGGVMGTVPLDDVTVAFALQRHATSAAAAVNWAL